nr:MAG TPA: hypothetical protein [Caudoviricetes sp.]
MFYFHDDNSFPFFPPCRPLVFIFLCFCNYYIKLTKKLVYNLLI